MKKKIHTHAPIFIDYDLKNEVFYYHGLTKVFKRISNYPIKSSLLSGSFLIKFSSLSPTKIEELTAGWGCAVFFRLIHLSVLLSLSDKEKKIWSNYPFGDLERNKYFRLFNSAFIHPKILQIVESLELVVASIGTEQPTFPQLSHHELATLTSSLPSWPGSNTHIYIFLPIPLSLSLSLSLSLTSKKTYFFLFPFSLFALQAETVS